LFWLLVIPIGLLAAQLSRSLLLELKLGIEILFFNLLNTNMKQIIIRLTQKAALITKINNLAYLNIF